MDSLFKVSALVLERGDLLIVVFPLLIELLHAPHILLVRLALRLSLIKAVFGFRHTLRRCLYLPIKHSKLTLNIGNAILVLLQQSY